MPGCWLSAWICSFRSPPSGICTLMPPGALNGVVSGPVKLGSISVSLTLPSFSCFCQTT